MTFVTPNTVFYVWVAYPSPASIIALEFTPAQEVSPRRGVGVVRDNRAKAFQAGAVLGVSRMLVYLS